MGRLTGELPLKTSLARRTGWLIGHRQHLTAEPLGRFAQFVNSPPFHRRSRGMSPKAVAAAWSMLVAIVLVVLMRAERARGIVSITMLMRLTNRRLNLRDRSLHRPHNVLMPMVGVAVMPVLVLVPAGVRVAPMTVARAVPAMIALTWAVPIRMTTNMTVIAGMAVRHLKPSHEQLGRNSHNHSKWLVSDEKRTHISTVANAASPGNVTPAPPCPSSFHRSKTSPAKILRARLLIMLLRIMFPCIVLRSGWHGVSQPT